MKRQHMLAAVLPLLIAAAPPSTGTDGRVTALSLAPAAGQTELTVQIDGGQVRWTDFSLGGPPRVVIDIAGVRNALPAGSFESINRGGISGLRTSQYDAQTVRVVIDLARQTRYTVSSVPEGLRIALATEAVAFQPWSTSAAGFAASAPAPARSMSARPMSAQPMSARPLSAQQVQQQTELITVSFEQADIRDVAQQFAEFTGRSIILGQNVTGTVTATITDQPWDVALATILRSQGLAYQVLPTGIIEVNSIATLREREVQEPLVTQTYRISYVPAAELVTTLSPLKTERGTVVSNASTNTLLVTDVEGALNRIGAMVQQLDIPTPQVAIQAKYVFLSRTNAASLGIRYDLRDSRGNQLSRIVPSIDPVTGRPVNRDLISLGGNSLAALGNAANEIPGATLEAVVSLVLGRFTLLAFIDALQSVSLADVEAEPLITTLDNQEANILVGQRTPIRIVDVGAGGAGAVPVARAELVETGIKLRVTPHITADRRILLQLRAENSDARPVAGEFGVVFDTQEGETRLLVKDGETAVIGGLTVTRVTRTRSGIPFLMDLPYVGALFGTTSNTEVKQDLLILVTPHIVEERV